MTGTRAASCHIPSQPFPDAPPFLNQYKRRASDPPLSSAPVEAPPIVDAESRKAKEKREKKKEVGRRRLIFLPPFARVKLELNPRAPALFLSAPR